mgnify:CR=1 FL=1
MPFFAYNEPSCVTIKGAISEEEDREGYPAPAQMRIAFWFFSSSGSIEK